MEFTSFLLGVFYLCMFISFCYCQGNYENVALNKPCNMSSQQHVQPDCSGAVNGNTNGRYMANGDNCIRTNPAENSSWWEVNLGRPYPVCNITIWPRLSDPDRMVGVSVSIDSMLFFTITATPTVPNVTIYCLNNTPRSGTVIRLYKDNTLVALKNRTINLCEVEVLSCNVAHWGPWCNETCGNCGNGEVCDKVTGHCTSCLQGWELPMCSVCKDGYWGSECKKCGNCSNNDVCDKVTGHCPSCSPGWKPPLCDTVSSREGDQASVGHVVGAAVGGVAALALTVALVFLLVRRHRSLQHQRTDAHVAGARDTTDTVAPTVPGRVDPQLPSGEPQAQEADPTGNSRMSTASAYIELMRDPPLYDRLALQRNQHIYAGLQNS